MAFSTVVSTLGGIALMADLAIVMSPSINDHAVVPKLESVLYTPMQDAKSRVSVHFQSAKVGEVLRWLQNNGFNFVLNDEDISNAKTITLNINNQPIRALADAIARSLGGHWETANGIHIFKKGLSSNNFMAVPSEGSFAWGDGFPMVKNMPDKDVEKLFGPDFDKKMQKNFGPKFQMKIEKEFGPEFQKKMQDEFGPKFQMKIEKEFGPEFQKKMQNQKWNDEKLDAKSRMDLEEKFGPKFQKHIEEMFGPKFQKQMEEQFGPKFQKQMEEQFGPKFQKQMEEMGMQMEKQMKRRGDAGGNSMSRSFLRSSPNKRNDDHSMFTMGGQGFDAVKFLGTLTPDEKDQMKKQGYVWYNDLTREQKAMFDKFDGKFDIDLKVNGEEIRVRRN